MLSSKAMNLAHVDDRLGEIIYAARTPPTATKFQQKRKGARKVKDVEKAKALADGPFTPKSATLYRAVSARGNYLSQDRVDISFGTKELCREFAFQMK